MHVLKENKEKKIKKNTFIFPTIGNCHRSRHSILYKKAKKKKKLNPGLNGIMNIYKVQTEM